MARSHVGRKRHPAPKGVKNVRKFPWYRLAAPGDHFTWPIRADEKSLRVQASRQGKRRGVIFTVHRAEVGQPALTVRYVRNLL